MSEDTSFRVCECKICVYCQECKGECKCNNRGNCQECKNGECKCKYSYEYNTTLFNSVNNTTYIGFTQTTDSKSIYNRYHDYSVSITKIGNKYKIKCSNKCNLSEDDETVVESVLSEIVTLRTILILIDLYNSPPLIIHSQSNNDINYNICYCDDCKECSDCYIGKCQCDSRDVYIVKLYNEESNNKIELKFTSFSVSDDDIIGDFHIKLNINDDFSSEIECINNTCFIDENSEYIVSNTVNEPCNLKFSVHIDNIIKLIDLYNEYS